MSVACFGYPEFRNICPRILFSMSDGTSLARLKAELG